MQARCSLMHATCSSYLIMTRGNSKASQIFALKASLQGSPHFVVKNFWGISQDDPWLILPYPSQRKNFKRVQNVTGLTAFKTLCIRVLITLKRQPSSAPGTGKRKKRSRGRQLWGIQLLREAVWWMASTGNNEQPWETGFCSRVPALSPLTCPTDLYAGAHGRDALALCKLKPSTIAPAKGLLPAVIPLTSISTQSGQMVTGLEVESWTLEDKASNLQICFRISTNQLRRKLKSWGMGVGTCFTLKGTASKQLHPGGYLRHIINLCSQGYFSIQSRKTEVLRIWWNAAYSSHNCGCEGQAWAHGVTTGLTHSSLGILTHKTFQSFLPCLVMRALLKCVNLKHAAEKEKYFVTSLLCGI